MFQLIHISISIVDIIVCICIVALLSVLFWFAILKCDRDKYIESSIQNGIQLIDMVLEQEPFDVSTPYISILKENAHENIKLCRLLATRDNVLKLINILKRGELIWRNKMTPKIPLTDKQVSDYFDIQYSNCLMYDCSELMNHLLPQFKDVGDIPFKEISVPFNNSIV
ncbi:hypothetical protein DFA_07954 [Cavenderia fasciculata]|uniref:Uncharacterized protein n=1 Tax=Cavenderia fasciculata TaxID=261658 RepID=F4Q4B1_CACFS|nr:uncharacterized protein DFA_07954 [Cavenderia fasciculata]EGG16973.1 hypothetical protein DFA_07954 [Cavenderia fasciculata]|eukprot:XP_004355453.1 hypothetical protein DFA_07954 [Cavenderia fasciculata]